MTIYASTAEYRRLVRLGVRSHMEINLMKNENGVGIATRILLINSVITVFTFVAQIASLVIYGPTHEHWFLYITLMLIMFVASLVAQWTVRRSVFAGMNFYAWVCFACIAGMACIDRAVLSTGFPLILFVLTLGVLGLGLTVGYTASVPFAAVCCVTVLVVGVMSGDLDIAIITGTLIAGIAAMSGENARTVKKLARTENKLDSLETAWDEYINAKRRVREQAGYAEHAGQDTGTHRCSES